MDRNQTSQPVWETLRDHIRGKYQLAVDHDATLGLLWTFPNADGVQRQRIESVTAFGSPHVVISCNVGTATSMSCHDALQHNATLAVGALCFVDGFLILRMVLPLDGVDLSVLDRSLQLVAHEAARLRSKATPKAAPAPYYE